MAVENDIFKNFDPRALQRAARIGRWLADHWFRYEIQGLENLPDGPCLVIGNHSGFGFAEELLFATTFCEEFPRRRAWGLIHDLFLSMPVIGRYYGAIGAVPASPANASAALDRGDIVLVFPGGDVDCCRPFYRPRTVDFGDRRGYVRLALETGVSVVPLATVGSHWTWTFLPGGRALARVPWIRRALRTDCVPLPTALFAVLIAAALAASGLDPWWTVAVVAILGLVPTPVRITSEVGRPIDLRTLNDLPKDERIERGHELVLGALQRSVATLDPISVNVTADASPRH